MIHQEGAIFVLHYFFFKKMYYLKTRPNVQVEKHLDNTHVSFIDSNVQCRLPPFVSCIEVCSVPGE